MARFEKPNNSSSIIKEIIISGSASDFGRRIQDDYRTLVVPSYDWVFKQRYQHAIIVPSEILLIANAKGQHLEPYAAVVGILSNFSIPHYKAEMGKKKKVVLVPLFCMEVALRALSDITERFDCYDGIYAPKSEREDKTTFEWIAGVKDGSLDPVMKDSALAAIKTLAEERSRHRNEHNISGL